MCKILTKPRTICCPIKLSNNKNDLGYIKLFRSDTIEKTLCQV